MSNIIGFSHLVFTVCNTDPEPASDFLNNFYLAKEYFEFDHETFRMPLIREEKNGISKLSLYKSKDGNLPAVELLHVDNVVKRPLTNYGIIAAKNNYSRINELKRLYFSENEFYVDYYYDALMNSPVATATNFFDNEKDPGCWMLLNDFEEQRTFFRSISNKKILIDKNDVFAVRTKVINKKLSNFIFVLVKDHNNGKYYNDDLGLSTLGWFTKGFDGITGEIELESSTVFPISLNGNYFDAKFFYNNQNISHEVLKIK